MTQTTIYTLILALGGVMLTLPLFGTSITPNKISPTEIDSPTDTGIIICTFLVFDAEPNNEGVLANWLNISQGNELVDYYELEHSLNAYDYETVATLEEDVISHLHTSPVSGLNYYRLKIIDISGTEMYTNIVGIEWDLSPGNIFPNIIDTEASIYIASPTEEPGELNIYDMAGRLIYSENITLNENSTLLSMDFGSLSVGQYVVTISGEQLGREVLRFVKQ